MSESEPLLEGRRVEGGAGAHIRIDGRDFLNFAGCNYLALASRPELKSAAQQILDSDSPNSMYLGPAYGCKEEPFQRVEAAAAAFFGTENAVYMPSGYHLGFAALAGLSPLYDAVVIDELAHYCLTDAARLSDAPVHTFKHGDADALEQVLATLPKRTRPLIATDGAFATTGRMAELKRYAELAERFDGQVIVDESHASGVVGASGRGAAQHFNLGDRVHIATTLSKSFCGLGSVYLGTKDACARAYVAPPLRGSSAGSQLAAAVSAAALNLVSSHPQWCADLREKALYLRQQLRSLGLDVIETPASIASFGHGSFNDMRQLQTHLFDKGIYLLHSNYIAAGPSGLLRMSVFADHSYQQLDQLVDEIGAALA
ncbi:MAG: pyridoxal phosphate-dependent aminotransferase family protein [Pseudomonadota bacterium]